MNWNEMTPTIPPREGGNTCYLCWLGGDIPHTCHDHFGEFHGLKPGQPWYPSHRQIIGEDGGIISSPRKFVDTTDLVAAWREIAQGTETNTQLYEILGARFSASLTTVRDALRAAGVDTTGRGSEAKFRRENT